MLNPSRRRLAGLAATMLGLTALAAVLACSWA